MTSAMDREVRVECYQNLRQIDQLVRAWSALWEDSPLATPFNHPAWVLAWFRQLEWREPWLLATWQSERLLGLLPLMQDNEGRLELAGGAIADRLDPLLRAGAERAAAGALLRFLAQQPRAWTECELRRLSPQATAWLSSDDTWPNRTVQADCEEVCPVVGLDAESDTLGGHVPPSRLTKWRYYRRRLQSLGRVTFQAATAATLAPMLDELLRLHSARWQEQGGGVLADSAVQQFHRQVAKGLLLAGGLHLFALALDGQTVGVFYGFRARQRVFYYLSGFDPRLAHLSLGTVLVGWAIEEAVRLGATRFDFLRGREAYKYTWGAQDERLLQITLRPDRGEELIRERRTVEPIS